VRGLVGMGVDVSMGILYFTHPHTHTLEAVQVPYPSKPMKLDDR
jgi:hypothetical protein